MRLTNRVLIAANSIACCVWFAAPVRADLITDVSANTSVTVANGSGIDVSFGTWTYAANNPGYASTPLNIQFEAYAVAPSSALVNVPGTNTQYYSGDVFTGYVESTSGTVIATIDDPAADRLGLPEGSILLSPATGTNNSGSQQFAMLCADLALTQSAAAALFGSSATSAWTADAVLVLTNDGAPVTFEAGGNTTVRSAFVEPSLSGAGPAQTAGVTLQVRLDQPGVSSPSLSSPSVVVSSVPEPGSAALLFAGALSVGAVFLYRSRTWHRSRKS